MDLQFHEQGVCCPARALDDKQVTASYDAVIKHYQDVMYTLRQLGVDQELSESSGYDTFKMRDKGRYDMVVPAFQTEQFSWFNKDAPWMPEVKAILGDDAERVYSACILSMPESAAQKWHSDGDHCHDSFQLPAHCINVFIPLVPLETANGPTEFIPGSHLDWYVDTTTSLSTPSLVLTAPAGQPIAFDHRIKHRCLANNSQDPRPLVYITYAKKWYVDLNNSTQAGYQKLPPLLSRS